MITRDFLPLKSLILILSECLAPPARRLLTALDGESAAAARLQPVLYSPVEHRIMTTTYLSSPRRDVTAFLTVLLEKIMIGRACDSRMAGTISSYVQRNCNQLREGADPDRDRR